MKRVLIFNGSPRAAGNTVGLINCFVDGASENTQHIEIIQVDRLNLKYCTGCLRCNVLGRCSLRSDDWSVMVEKMVQADVLVFASPIYFHHVSAQLKKLIDRFRSLLHIQITETGLIHTPVNIWDKEVVVLFAQGSPDPIDSQPAIEMFEFLVQHLFPGKKLYSLIGTRLAVSRQFEMTEEELVRLYGKLNLSHELAQKDIITNLELKKQCIALGYQLTK